MRSCHHVRRPACRVRSCLNSGLERVGRGSQLLHGVNGKAIRDERGSRGRAVRQPCLRPSTRTVSSRWSLDNRLRPPRNTSSRNLSRDSSSVLFVSRTRRNVIVLSSAQRTIPLPNAASSRPSSATRAIVTATIADELYVVVHLAQIVA